ncbi:S-adenosyl-L-methionine-dependent methyltransferase [Dentipellis sp. KUC8613]|nr:S-adenosyl-L-methionine-dependent methyltransferase [Dentipellis sp. KUC8613]
MATFSKATFNTARYAAARPTYPRQLFDFVFKYHERTRAARWDTAVDLGCGTGQATVELTPFRRVVGVDPSAKMVAAARAFAKETAAEANSQTEFEFVQSAAEELPFLKDGSVDLIVAAQAAHWFDWTQFWPEAARVLRKGGSAAFWGYSEFRLTHHLSATPLIHAYSQGSDPATSLGPHWQQPGRRILDNHFLEVPRAVDVLPNAFGDWEHVFFTGQHFPDLPKAQTHPVILRKRMAWDDLLTYLRTFSSLHTFHERYPEDLKNPSGDIALRFWKSLQEHVRSERIKSGESKAQAERDEVDVEWPVAIMLVKRI